MRIPQLFTCIFLSFCCLATAQPLSRTGKNYATFFYVTKFQPGWKPLPETETEAKTLKAELESNYDFVCRLVPNPTKQQILDELAATNERLTKNDQVLYFFSMHGLYSPENDLGYLVAADGQYQDTYAQTYLNYNALRPYFSNCKAKHMLVALDACYSGSFGTSRDRARPDAPDFVSGPDCASQVAAALRYDGRQYVCSGNKDARTPAQSAFASKFLEALRKGPRDGLLFFDDLTYWLGKVRNPEPEHGAFAGHQPGGDFVFLRKNACATAPALDRDGDGVLDSSDKCPDTWGSQADGCPTDIKTDDTARDLAAWKTAKQRDTEAGYQEYLRSFPQGEFKDLANAALRQREAVADKQRDDVAWEIAFEKNTTEGYKKYVAGFPNGLHRSEADAKLKPVDMPDNMVLVPGGSFQMGSDDGEADEKPVHTVTLSSFYLGKYEVTVAEFKVFVEASGYQTDAEKQGKSWVYTDIWKEQSGVNWKYDTRGNLRPSTEYNHPVIHVSWNDAMEYCKWLSKKTGLQYRLPTEAEWEYAAGGSSGARTKWAGSSDENQLTRYANTDGNKDGHQMTSPVGSLLPNVFGLYDMSGNVSEPCSDWYSSDYSKISNSTNPSGSASGYVRVLRGGSWNGSPKGCRVANRHEYAPAGRNAYIGFRLAMTK